VSGRWRYLLAGLVVCLVLFGRGRLSAQWALAGHARAEVRIFPEPPLADVQPKWVSASARLQPELTIPLGDRLRFRAIALGRVDQSDPERSYADLREALVQWDQGAVTVSVGVNTVFWGVTESRHLVNVVNQTDYLDDLDGDERFGQLMALVTYSAGDLGDLNLLAMTWARPQRYPGRDGRPGVPLPVLDDSPAWESEHGKWNLDFAARWSRGLGEVHWALSYFQGTTREPGLVPVGSVEAPTLRPHYDLIRQSGLELQWTHGSWLWKGEGIVRSGQGPTFAAVTGGFEHTTFGLFGSAPDLGVILEYSYDGRDNLTYRIHDDDVFGGLRLSFNDVRGTEALAGVLQDVNAGVTLGSLEASRRLGGGWRAELVARLFRADVHEDPVYWFRRDDYLQVVMEYHF
jgi:hypothetical protein